MKVIKTVSTTNVREFDGKINELLADGYDFDGEMIVTQKDYSTGSIGGSDTVFTQRLIKVTHD